jgi:DnaJ-class molecular chaperone
MDYWKECISEALDDIGVSLTDGQITALGSWIEGAHENHGTATGQECIPNPLVTENDNLQKELDREKSKVICTACDGTGVIRIDGPCHFSTSSCWKCNGEGRHLP